MAGAFFGAFQSALETTGKLAAALDDTPPDEPTPDVDVRPVNIRPAVKAVAKPAAESKPVVEKKARPKLTVVVPVSAPMPATKPAPAAKAKPVTRTAKADDLKLIAGIGPKLEQVLNAKGIRSFAEIAGWSDEEIARLDAELGFNGRIGRDDWPGINSRDAGSQVEMTMCPAVSSGRKDGQIGVRAGASSCRCRAGSGSGTRDREFRRHQLSAGRKIRLGNDDVAKIGLFAVSRQTGNRTERRWQN
jgi:predicted flap endonuclease-1-like 5' DNA nuclease